jgi:hypothetical protein
MADYQPDLVTAAARSLEASRTEMRDVNARWQRMRRSPAFPNGRRRLAVVLGPPVHEEIRCLGDVECEIARWPLWLWPGLLYEVLTAPDGTVLQEWLVRAPDVPVPELETVADLAPWSCVVGDMDRLFAPVEHSPGEVPSRWHVGFSADGAAYVAHFVWGLLQAVEMTGSGRRDRLD